MSQIHVVLHVVFSIVLNAFLAYLPHDCLIYLTGIMLFGLASVANLVLLWQLPVADENLSFAVPAVPLIPAVAIFVNIALILQLSWMTWVRFVVWMAIGLSIYFGYGIHHDRDDAVSKEGYDNLDNVSNEENDVGTNEEDKQGFEYTKQGDTS